MNKIRVLSSFILNEFINAENIYPLSRRLAPLTSLKSYDFTGTAGLFDFLFGSGREVVRFDFDCFCNLAFRQNLQGSLGFAEDTFHSERSLVHFGTSFKSLFNCSKVDNVENCLDAALESDFRQTSECRSLTAFKVMSDGSSGTGTLTFVAASGCSAPTRTVLRFLEPGVGANS